MQQIAPLSESLTVFLRQDDLLANAMLFFLREQFRTDARFEKTLAALRQEAILFNQARMLALMEQLHLSSQVKASDEFTRHDTKSQRIIQQSVFNLKHLESRAAEYTQLTLMVGCASSSTGNLPQSDALFSQVIDNTRCDEEKAQAYFNRFYVRLRHLAYDTALADLQAAIELNPERYALHDVNTYPMLALLGAGGMGCVFLCQNKNPLIDKTQVVVKCFWETLQGAPEKVFKEAVAMRKIAGDYVPEPLHAGYANPFKQERAYFVTAYQSGTINGETLIWLPWLMPTLALGLELLPHSAKAWSPDIYLLWSAGVFVYWLLTGRLGNIDLDNDAMVVSVVGIVAVGVAGIVAGGVAIGVTGGVAKDLMFSVAGGVAAIVVASVAKSLRTCTPSWIARFAFLLLVAAHIFLIG
ncbi:MAG: hypothetical protein DRR19_23860 [Candidatus Parabeggiatoa sp. nov. 1]|nr:MAG: hypothetical protein DRR19_23860 [Gammaproteobacteria bacterium]